MGAQFVPFWVYYACLLNLINILFFNYWLFENFKQCIPITLTSHSSQIHPPSRAPSLLLQKSQLQFVLPIRAWPTDSFEELHPAPFSDPSHLSRLFTLSSGRGEVVAEVLSIPQSQLRVWNPWCYHDQFFPTHNSQQQQHGSKPPRGFLKLHGPNIDGGHQHGIWWWHSPWTSTGPRAAPGKMDWTWSPVVVQMIF